MQQINKNFRIFTVFSVSWFLFSILCLYNSLYISDDLHKNDKGRIHDIMQIYNIIEQKHWLKTRNKKILSIQEKFWAYKKNQLIITYQKGKQKTLIFSLAPLRKTLSSAQDAVCMIMIFCRLDHDILRYAAKQGFQVICTELPNPHKIKQQLH